MKTVGELLKESLKARAKKQSIKQWLKEVLSKEDYNKAKKYKNEHWKTNVDNFTVALREAFDWRNTEEGAGFWWFIYVNDLTVDEPKERSLDMIVESVREDLLRRSQVGIEKYGTTLERTDIDENGWKSHLYEELLDAACYLKRLMVENKNK